jgi:predicted XRE-type DNA-binding protein
MAEISKKRKSKAGANRGVSAGDAQSVNFIARTELMLAVCEAIKRRNWTQAEAAKFFGVGQPRISDLFQGRIDRFTADMLMMWLQKLGMDVSVSIRSSVFGTEEKIQLALYVCGVVEKRVLDNVAALFGGDKERYSLKVINVLEQAELTASERITATPSLVKEAPKPRIVLTGDLSARSVRWQLAIAEQSALENRYAAQDLRQANQDRRESEMDEREERMEERQKRNPR